MTYLMKAAEQGHAEAQWSQALAFKDSEDDAWIQPYLALLQKAAASGFALAQTKLGTLHQAGKKGLEKNFWKAKELFELSAAQGDADAIAALKKMRSCAGCGAAHAKYRCTLCKETKYCSKGGGCCV
jgi:TPR repeat protein